MVSTIKKMNIAKKRNRKSTMEEEVKIKKVKSEMKLVAKVKVRKNTKKV